MKPKRLRCAIYTRKSSDEGLDQSFNSLDAQRAACEAYIVSQAGEGWVALPTLYDDGGYSGGSMERPALKQILADVAAGKIDIVVVYKVDRLTRALTDFARIIEVLDNANASFVSITQNFSTTTSMGRLTLNVLLSFAQFEREVTGERIRDKFAASKARGMWMGGDVPLGYDVRDRALHINEAEAALVRRIYDGYLELGSVPALTRRLEAEGARTKSWISVPGRKVGGCVFSTRHLNDILKSRLYRGEISHRGKVHQGAHEALVSPEVWDAVEAKLLAHASRKRGGSAQAPSNYLLTGLLFDDAGNAMSPTHAKKGERRYRYYCSAALLHDKRGTPGSIARVPAPAIDQAVRDAVGPLLTPGWLAPDAFEQRVVAALVRIEIRSDGLFASLRHDAVKADPLLDADHREEVIVIKVAASPRKRRGAVIIDAHMPARTNPALVRAVVLARHWAEELSRGEADSVRDIARRHKLCHLYVGKLLPLAYLAPDLVSAILDGRQPRGLSISKLLSEPLPMSWRAQRARFLDVG